MKHSRIGLEAILNFKPHDKVPPCYPVSNLKECYYKLVDKNVRGRQIKQFVEVGGTFLQVTCCLTGFMFFFVIE